MVAIGGGVYFLAREERKPSDSPPSENPIIKREREIKEEVLNHFSLEESKIETLLSWIPYVQA